MFCPACGNEIDDKSKFCSKCGKSLSSDSAAVEAPSKETSKKNVSHGDEAQKPAKANKTVLLILEIILWLGAVFVALNLFSDTGLPLAGILFNEITLIAAIGYFKGWHDKFSLSMVLLVILLLLNIALLSIVDVVVFTSGIVAIYLKNKELG